ncbi:MAG: histidine kinase [Lachnospiraceae bacterium]|nr:histidine kinase [Lachnospiraceae bacterium]
MNNIRTFLFSLEIWGIILCVIAGICVYNTRSYDSKVSTRMIRLLIVEILQDICEIVLIVLGNSDLRWMRYISTAVAFMAFLFNILLILMSAGLIGYIVKKATGRKMSIRNTIIRCFCAINAIFAAVSVFTDFYFVLDEHNVFRRGPYVFVYHIMTLGCLAILLTELLIFRKDLEGRAFFGQLAIVVIPAGGIILELLGYGNYSVNISTTVSYILLISIFESDYAELLVAKEKMVRDEQIRLFNHQIQPHFIFNTLTAIRSMCEEDSKAIMGIDSFAAYLRGCVDMMTKTECVSVKNEMSVVDSFLEIIKMRFGDKIKTEKNIEDIDFTVPPFSIQCIVENAYYHGIRKKEGGTGNLWISIYSKDESNIVEITDDGVGFDPEKIFNNKEDETHIGLTNTIRRVEAMSGGDVVIDSGTGRGTTVKLIFPVKRT